MIVTVTSNKGGVGKTTTATAIAHGLARRGHSVVLCDTDRQGQCAVALGYDPEPGIFNLFVNHAAPGNVLRDTERPGLRLLPSNSRTKTAEQLLMIEGSIDETVQTFRNLAGVAGFLVIDCAASGFFQEQAVRAADYIIIPTRAEYLSMDGVAQTLAMVKGLNATAKLHIEPIAVDRRLVEHKDIYAAIAGQWPDLVTGYVPNRVAVTSTASMGSTIWESTDRGIEEVQARYDELLKEIEDGQATA